jgi:hypothetical protein
MPIRFDHWSKFDFFRFDQWSKFSFFSFEHWPKFDLFSPLAVMRLAVTTLWPNDGGRGYDEGAGHGYFSI